MNIWCTRLFLAMIILYGVFFTMFTNIPGFQPLLLLVKHNNFILPYFLQGCKMYYNTIKVNNTFILLNNIKYPLCCSHISKFHIRFFIFQSMISKYFIVWPRIWNNWKGKRIICLLLTKTHAISFDSLSVKEQIYQDSLVNVQNKQALPIFACKTD